MVGRSYPKQEPYTREEVAKWLTGTNPSYIGEKYDPDVGWVHTAGHFRHGIDPEGSEGGLFVRTATHGSGGATAGGSSASLPTPQHVRGAICEYSYEASGARRMTLYPDKACRINTYGDSFTHGDQVSDGETWQERLGAHLCEPV